MLHSYLFCFYKIPSPMTLHKALKRLNNATLYMVILRLSDLLPCIDSLLSSLFSTNSSFLFLGRPHAVLVECSRMDVTVISSDTVLPACRWTSGSDWRQPGAWASHPWLLPPHLWWDGGPAPGPGPGPGRIHPAHTAGHFSFVFISYLTHTSGAYCHLSQLWMNDKLFFIGLFLFSRIVFVYF